MKKFPRTRAIGKLGVAFVANVVFEAGSIFREVPQDTDVGIDGYIEFVESGTATGTLVGVQIKAGSSYHIQHKHRGGQCFKVKVSREDLNYWNVQPIPIALITYDPETSSSGWLDITGYIRRNPKTLDQGYTTLTIESTEFNVATFQSEFKGTFRAYRLEADLFGFADLMASNDPPNKFRGFLGLLSHPTSRFSRLTCFLLLKHLSYYNDALRAAVSDTLSRYLPHPEVGFFPPPEIRDYVQAALGEFGRQEIISLLETAWLDEENLMQRGSLGQSVGVIITNIPEYEHHLCELAIDDSQSYKARWAAIALAAEFGIDAVVRCVGRNFDRIKWGDVYDAAQWAAEESLRIEVAEVDFLGIIEREGYDADQLADVLRDASLYLLIENEAIIARISTETSNPYVRFESSRALSRVIEWRDPPGQHMQKLL